MTRRIMDRRTLLGLGAAGAAGLLAAGCSSSTTGGTPAGSAAPAASGSAAGGKKLSVVSVVNGPLGDAMLLGNGIDGADSRAEIALDGLPVRGGLWLLW